ncbi:hypothetical protein PPERSA_12213 [Pseudocohnilembus persalinus]|uniref:Uncharacterized protein n=1 Tax=Pseudocohnilembus persalinus TaxID=266149 RepID=A0A0V0R8R6_PSEPJ|nr:hypothetical protein PPERSA_12213 [Pseudocohnilembus persalinus]|eukprot:KRX10862.1 hypothetical protein PPERSA_12213 [Pseudocohnilembus persalinus]
MQKQNKNRRLERLVEQSNFNSQNPTRMEQETSCEEQESIQKYHFNVKNANYQNQRGQRNEQKTEVLIPQIITILESSKNLNDIKRGNFCENRKKNELQNKIDTELKEVNISNKNQATTIGENFRNSGLNISKKMKKSHQKFQLDLNLEYQQEATTASSEKVVSLTQNEIKDLQREDVDKNFQQKQKFSQNIFYPEPEFRIQKQNPKDYIHFEYLVYCQRSQYDHVACFMNDMQGLWIFDIQDSTNVQKISFENYVKYSSLVLSMSYRKIYYNDKFMSKDDFHFSCATFLFQNYGAQFKIGLSQLLRRNSTVVNQKTYFCSSFLAKMFKQQGLLPPDKSASSDQCFKFG